ncbi:hypothetical protein [Ruminococcus sp.]|uniref:hypothetical protein n=1 Tax=Ruminococcus sp. TaxID=41978 RepID=UPI0025F9D9AB|nr:hypothetical protein [Ruminococcus sp.]
MVERNKWILYKHTSSYDMIKAVALDVKNSCKTDISDTERYRMQERLAALNLYHTRNPKDKPLDAINHRINTLEFWMFGYENIDKDKKFMFSPLGNLFLKYINDEQKLIKIFVAMLFAIQFQHPASGTDKSFQLYPFRLIFKLLTDERLSGKLYNFEYAQILAFKESIDHNKYENLVKEILDLRSKSIDEIKNIYLSDEHTYVNAVYEWEYYTCTLLSSIGIFREFSGDIICKLYHPSKTGSRSNPTGRKATNGYVELQPQVIPFITRMLNEYSAMQMPISLDDNERLRIDIIKEIYSFYPQVLMEEIGESDELTKLLELPKLIEEYSNNPDNDTAYKFEEVLTEGFDMFYNVKTKRIGGAGHTDIECLYLTKKKKFAVESKSTANKLIGINAGRLREQREEIGGAYTIVITSRYVPAAKRDIKDTPIVIILANTFAEYLYNHIFNEIRDIDYKDFDDIIVNHLGEDVSKLISKMTLDKFATTNKK